jgi:hypothetical protein
MKATFTPSCSTGVVRIEHGFEEEMEQSNREEHEWGLGGASEGERPSSRHQVSYGGEI